MPLHAADNGSQPAIFDFEAFPTLETDRLILRELTEDDIASVFIIRGNYNVTRFNGGLPYVTIDQAGMLISAVTNAYKDRRALRWGITLKDDPTVIGMVGFNYWLRQDHRGSIGYDLAESHWGQGIMTEAVHAIARFGFSRMGLLRIEADTAVENVGSRRVLEKVGFKRTGIQLQNYYEGGRAYDLMLFALLKEDYSPTTP